MKTLVITLFAFLSTLFQSRRSLQFEIIALRHQLNDYQRTVKRPRIGPGDRVLWYWFAHRWSGWRSSLVFVQTGTVIAWQHKRFCDHRASEQARQVR